MKEPLISIKLHNASRQYQAGSILSGESQIDAVDPTELEAVETSVLWYTEGKGDEDLGVHHFERVTAEAAGATLHELRQFSTKLPNSPRSYEGVLVKIRWCVRVRVFLRGGRNVFAELPFELDKMAVPETAVQPA